jgi:hypothetical protein
MEVVMHPVQKALTCLLAEAQAQPGKKITTRLGRQLQVDCKVEPQRVLLQISRPCTWPSLQDWALLQAHWPQPFHLLPGRARGGGRGYFWAVFPFPAEAQGKP